MSKLSHYIKLRNSAIGCDAKQFECDKYLDCDSCLEDKIKEHDKQIRADAVDECIEVFRNIPRHYYLDEFLNELEQLKEQEK